jgi:hypothetical protein
MKRECLFCCLCCFALPASNPVLVHRLAPLLPRFCQASPMFCVGYSEATEEGKPEREGRGSDSR